MKTPCDEALMLSGRVPVTSASTAGHWILAATTLGSSMAFIDSIVVNVALPTLQATFHASVVEKIAIRGTQKNYEVAVDARGKFEIPAIPPGRYTIVLESNETVNIRPPHLPTTFDLADKACARFSFWIDPFAKVDPGVQSAPRTDLHN